MEFENSTQTIPESQFQTNDDIVINVDHVGKMYKLFDQPIDRLKHTLFWRFGQKYGRDFWALHDISFQVRRGQTVGIIGRNGSGKSTLLQLIAGTLQPTIGSINTNGRISALLELGSGFNPEYSGRENVFLNGAILGISHEEMEHRFIEITNFADIGEFIDQPVKFYSSGMYARLAFSVAVMVDPDILIVDEILAVGDMLFQARCFEKIKKMMSKGTTTLFVTHDYGLVQQLCSYAYLLEGGQVFSHGDPVKVSLQYYEMMRETAQENQKLQNASPDQVATIKAQTRLRLEEIRARQGNSQNYQFGNYAAKITDYHILNSENQEKDVLIVGEDFKVIVEISFYDTVRDLSLAVFFRSPQGQNLMVLHTFYDDNPMHFGLKQAGEKMEITFDQKMMLNPGKYILSMALADHITEREFTSLDNCNNMAPIQIIGNNRLYSGIFEVDRKINWKIYQ